MFYALSKTLFCQAKEFVAMLRNVSPRYNFKHITGVMKLVKATTAFGIL